MAGKAAKNTMRCAITLRRTIASLMTEPAVAADHSAAPRYPRRVAARRIVRRSVAKHCTRSLQQAVTPHDPVISFLWRSRRYPLFPGGDACAFMIRRLAHVGNDAATPYISHASQYLRSRVNIGRSAMSQAQSHLPLHRIDNSAAAAQCRSKAREDAAGYTGGAKWPGARKPSVSSTTGRKYFLPAEESNSEGR